MKAVHGSKVLFQVATDHDFGRTDNIIEESGYLSPLAFKPELCVGAFHATAHPVPGTKPTTTDAPCASGATHFSGGHIDWESLRRLQLLIRPTGICGYCGSGANGAPKGLPSGSRQSKRL
jgi:hypothetical protein